MSFIFLAFSGPSSFSSASYAASPKNLPASLNAARDSLAFSAKRITLSLILNLSSSLPAVFSKSSIKSATAFVGTVLTIFSPEATPLAMYWPIFHQGCSLSQSRTPLISGNKSRGSNGSISGNSIAPQSPGSKISSDKASLLPVGSVSLRSGSLKTSSNDKRPSSFFFVLSNSPLVSSTASPASSNGFLNFSASPVACLIPSKNFLKSTPDISAKASVV